MPDQDEIIIECVDEDGEKGPKRRRATWEYGIFAVIFFMVVWFIWFGYVEIAHVKKITLRQELFQIRNAVMIYAVINKAMPPDLKALLDAKVKDPRGNVEFGLLGSFKTDKKGKLLDPFGNPYLYDSKTGRVESVSPCCRSW